MRVLVVGGVAGGASAAARIRRLNEEAEIIIFERGEHVSYSNCCLPYYLGGVVADSDSLLMMNPEAFSKRFNIEARVNSEVTAIDRVRKVITVRNTVTGDTYEEAYDKLILSTGAAAVRPRSIAGINGENVFPCKNVTDAVKLKSYIAKKGCKNVAVLGGGFIGLEVAENLAVAGLKVTLFEGLDQVMAPFDNDMAQLLHKELYENGIELHLNTMVSEITDHSVIGKHGEETVEVAADAVVLSIGVAPETRIATEAGLETGSARGLVVNHNYQTADEDIYAVGDVIESYNRLTGKQALQALAGPAQRQARAAADHICGMANTNRGYYSASCIKVFGLNAACTGLNEKTAQKNGIPYDVAYVLPADKVGIMPEANYMAFKLVFETPTGRILGAQAIGKGNVTRRVDVIATMIAMGGTLEQLKDLELCYSPVFGTAKDVVNVAALVGLNILNGVYKQVRVGDVRKLVESGAVIIDVREAAEYEAGHINGAKNIPLSQLRNRLDEVPRDVPVYLHCRTSQRSYYAICNLQGHGYKNVFNISGSFLGLSLHEYFTDISEKREPIVTAYNFN